MEKKKEYYIGLDIGTDSIGWAVTDKDYNILKFKGNAQWGIRLLEESKAAKERRVFRSARRRLERKKFRQQCLEMLFNEEISKVDVSFFQRLKDSNLRKEDKSVSGKYSVFNDEEYTDVDYHKEYPTIYHLRKKLLESQDKVDVRLVYLAVSHIVKNRGHFLFDSDSLESDGILSFESAWNEVAVYLNDELGVMLDCENISQVKDVIKDMSLSVTVKRTRLAEAFAITKKDEPQYSVISLLSGATVNTSDLFNDESLKGTECAKIKFSNSFDDKSDVYNSVLGERFQLVERLKAIYDWAILADIKKEHAYMSQAKCEVYDKHCDDLKLLKEYVRKFAPSKYGLIFNVSKEKLNNYTAYSAHYKKSDIIKKCGHQDFLDFLKKELPKEPKAKKYEKMYEEIAVGIFLPKIVTKDNAVIPMQINKQELVKILENASCYLEFLNNVDFSGKSVKEKIIDIFSFRIPYYVGPLNLHTDKAWVERTPEKIYPWNFYDIVDVDKSAEKFIERLTSKCTYIPAADVVPKNSLLYSRFMVLNELNNLKLDGKPISVELKQKIYGTLFMNNNKVTNKALKNCLKLYGFENCEITGIDGDFKSTLKPLRDFADFNLTDDEKEEIIKAITIFGDDKKLLRKRLFKQFADKLSNEEIQKISKLKYSGWGRLSKEFLGELKGVCKDTGEIDSIIGFLWSTNHNIMELLSKEYTFTNALEEINGQKDFSTLKKEVDSLYVSPKVKRPIYQAMQIVEELVKINGCEPEKIFIEVARGAEEKVRKASRKERLVELYKACKKDNEELYKSLMDIDESEFRRDALYLYYTQFGKCMYTGETIPIESIFDKNLYDIDHIFPQSKIKDDSLDNRVLVTKKANEDKSNIYPVNRNIQEDRKSFWQMLLSKELISKKKYERLTRSTPLTEDDLSAFISRQIVETRQSTKAVAQLLEKRYASKIVYVKAGLVSDFRHPDRYDFVKCREVNDFHHAKDAYLNIVVGNVYNTRFTQNYFISELREGKVSLNKLFDYPIKGAWVTEGKNKSIDIVRKTMSKNNIRFTRHSFKKKGGLFDQNVLKKCKGQVPVKTNSPLVDIEKYGGYNNATTTYFSLISYFDKNEEKCMQLVPVDLHDERKYLDSPDAYVKEKLASILSVADNEINNIKILIPCIKINALVSIDGFRMHISGKISGGKSIKYKSAMQLVVGDNEERYIKKISKYLEKCQEDTKKTSDNGVSQEENVTIYNLLLDKLENTVLSVKFSKTANTMRKNRNVFIKLPLKRQCEVLMQLLNILHANAVQGDLTLIGGAKDSGTVTTGGKILPSKSIKSFKFIDQSVTGLFEKEIEIVN